MITNPECEQYVAKEVPLFIWIEGPSMYARSEFVAFYKKIKVFMESNCAHIRPTTLVIRTAHPYYVPKADIVYWPPKDSPLFTELLAKLDVGSEVGVLLYPYVFDEFSRSQWVKFADSKQVDSVLPRPVYNASSPAASVLESSNVYDGIYQYVKGWQQAVAQATTKVSIDGFVIDYEEIYRYPDSGYIIELSADEISPYRSLYPGIKIGTTIGYDDSKKLSMFEPYMDYLFLQAYDLYYPYVGADATKDSPFLAYQDDPERLTTVLMQKVFTSKILTPYQSMLKKIFIMWSTQSLQVKDCLYKINDGSCGINNELGSWKPETFNALMQTIMKADPTFSAVQHGMYTYNFVTPKWLPASARAMP
jgi:hypothetical protein